MTNYFRKLIYLVVVAASFAAHASDYDDFFRAARADNANSDTAASGLACR